VPELGRVPRARIHAPWTMTASEQAEAHCIIGRDYPGPLVDHAEARKRTLARYGILKACGSSRMCASTRSRPPRLAR